MHSSWLSLAAGDNDLAGFLNYLVAAVQLSFPGVGEITRNLLSSAPLPQADALLLPLKALNLNKMRSILTMLGIIIGVGAVIAMVGIGEGASNLVQSQIASLGDKALLGAQKK